MIQKWPTKCHYDFQFSHIDQSNLEIYDLLESHVEISLNHQSWHDLLFSSLISLRKLWYWAYSTSGSSSAALGQFYLTSDQVWNVVLGSHHHWSNRARKAGNLPIFKQTFVDFVDSSLRIELNWTELNWTVMWHSRALSVSKTDLPLFMLSDWPQRFKPFGTDVVATKLWH